MTTSLRALTGLRFLAAAMVVLFHLETLTPALTFAPEALRQVARYGSSTVGLFFILSGFILSYSYLGGNRALNRRTFWVARFSRIYPVYVVCLLLAAPLSLDNPFAPGTHLVRFLSVVLSTTTLTQAWLPSASVAWNGPAWSLSAEAFFYLVFPFAAPLLMRSSVPTAAVLLGVAWAACLAPPLIAWAAFPDRLTEESVRLDGWVRVLRFNPLIRFPEFAGGILLARIFILRSTLRSPTRLRPFSSVYALAALGVLVAVWLASPAIPFLMSNNGVFDPLFAVLIYALASGGGVLGRVLSLRPAVWLGEASYALYLLHIPAMQWVTQLHEPGAFLQPWFTLGYVGLAIAASVVVFGVVERPARAWLRRILNTKNARVARAGPLQLATARVFDSTV